MKTSRTLGTLSLAFILAVAMGVQRSQAAGAIIIARAPQILIFAGVGGALYATGAAAKEKSGKSGRRTPSERDTGPGNSSHGGEETDPRYGGTDRGGSDEVDGRYDGGGSSGSGWGERDGGSSLFKVGLLLLGSDEKSAEPVSIQAHLQKMVEIHAFSPEEIALIEAELASKVDAQGELQLDLSGTTSAEIAAQNGISQLTAEYLLTLMGVNE